MLNAFLIPASLLAGFLFWWATAVHGIGIRTDSVTYLWVAESLAKGIGFGIMDAFGHFRPINHWPPLYSLILSIFVWLSALVNLPVSAEQVSRVLGFLLTSANVYIFGLLTAKISHKSFLFVVGGVIVLLSSPIFWETYLYAMSEPLFIFFSLLAVYYFMEYTRTFSNQAIFWAGLAAGLSLFTRYVGIFLFLVMGVSIFFYMRRPLKQKIRALAQILAIGLLPIFLWSLRNFSATGSPTNRRLVFIPITSAEWDMLLASLADWFGPLIKMFKIIPLGLAILLAFCLLIASLFIYYKKRVYGNNESQEMRWKILVACILSYSFFLVFSRLFFDSSIPLEESRMFFPIYLGLILLVISLLSNARDLKYVVLGKYVFLAAFGVMFVFGGLFAGISVQKTTSFLLSSRNNGLSLNSTGFKNRPVWLALRELVVDARDPVYFSDNVEKLYWANKTPSAILTGIDESLVALFQPTLMEHDIIIVLIDNPSESANVYQYLPAAKKFYKDTDGAIFIIHNTDNN